jgi:hypothetical protein
MTEVLLDIYLVLGILVFIGLLAWMAFMIFVGLNEGN